jgi:glycosyltransferase involved in cell wall biosynthesis
LVTILFAGHNFHFIEELMKRFSKDGHTVIRDQWGGHSIHDEETSYSLLSQADIIVCEWALGNSVWYSNHKRSDQQLFIRFHRQEIETDFPSNIAWSAVEKTIFVSPIFQHKAIEKYSIPIHKTTFIPNYVDTSRFPLKKSSNSKYTIGMLGVVPRLKRLDRALDILKIVRAKDPRFNLRIKGKLPEDYDWMLKREEEMNWYREQFDRIESDPDLIGHVHFDAWGPDVPEWFTNINHILSVSDVEAFHLAIAEGAASGAAPIVVIWEGAEQFYPPHWCHDGLESAAQAILDGTHSSQNGLRWSRVIRNRYDIKKIHKHWNELLGLRKSILSRFVFTLTNLFSSSPMPAGIQVEEE